MNKNSLWKLSLILLILPCFVFAGYQESEAAVKDPQTISIYDKHSVVLTNDSNGHSHLLSWGWNAFDQLALQEIKQTANPHEVTTYLDQKVTAVEAGGIHSLVLTEYGEVFSFGSNDSGQLGTSVDDLTVQQPKQVMAYQKTMDGTFEKRKLTNVVEISAGDSHSLALRSDGTVWSFGSNQFGQLGQHEFKSTGNKSIAEQVIGLKNITQIVSYKHHNLALDESGNVWAWGENWGGQLPVSFAFTKSPYKIKGLPAIKEVTTGDSHSLALDHNGKVWSWGSHDFGLRPDGLESSTPFQVPSLPVIEHVTAGSFHNLAIDEQGHVWSWGDNAVGELGIDVTATVTRPPSKIPNLTNVTEVDAGNRYSMAKTEEGTIYTWGLNDYGQLGDGTAVNRSTPASLTLTLAQGVTINRETISLKPGEKANLEAQLTPEGAVTTNITWSSNNSDLVSVTPDGTIQAAEDINWNVNHKVEIKASILDGTYSDTVLVTVLIPVQGVDITKKLITLERTPTSEGITEESYPLQAIVLPYNASDKRVIWKSADPSIAKVNTQGEITSVSEGRTTVTATTIDGGYVDSVDVEVTIPVNQIFITGSEYDLYLEQDETKQLEYTIFPPEATEQYVYQWESSDSSVARVTQTGEVIAVSEGTAEITVTTLYKRKKGTITVHVYPEDYIRLSAFELADQPIQMDAESQYQLSPTFYPVRATNKRLIYSSSDPTIATVDQNGLITTVSSGTVTIRGRSVDTGKVDTVQVTVGPSEDGWLVKKATHAVSPHKYWKVTFNTSIDPDTLTNQSVYIRDRYNQKLSLQTKLVEGRELYILPESELTPGETYHLFINDEVQSTSERSLNSKVKFTFRVEP